MDGSAGCSAEADLDNHICICDHAIFGIASGVTLYPDSNSVRWYYIGRRRRSCNLIGVFAHWKNESGDTDAFMTEA